MNGFCIHCGAQLDEVENGFCIHCGAPLRDGDIVRAGTCSFAETAKGNVSAHFDAADVSSPAHQSVAKDSLFKRIKCKFSKKNKTSDPANAVDAGNCDSRQYVSSFALDDSDEETFVATETFGDDEQTMVLQEKTQVLLKRVSTGETLLVELPAVIGKGSAADCCVSGNSTISRMHARIYEEGGKVYLQDCGSTNGTSLNGNRIASRAAVDMGSGAVLSLSDEEFVYLGRTGD